MPGRFIVSGETKSMGKVQGVASDAAKAIDAGELMLLQGLNSVAILEREKNETLTLDLFKLAHGNEADALANGTD